MLNSASTANNAASGNVLGTDVGNVMDVDAVAPGAGVSITRNRNLSNPKKQVSCTSSRVQYLVFITRYSVRVHGNAPWLI